MSSDEGSVGSVPGSGALPPGQHWRDEPEIMHYGPVPRLRPDRWTFVVGGATADGLEHTFEWADLAALPRQELVADMHCATRWSAAGLRWAGPRALDVVALAPPAAEIARVLVFAEYGYAANVPLADLRTASTLLATTLDGAPLSVERGAPMRLVIPHLYTWKGPKWVRGWNYLTAEDTDLGFWEQRGYHRRGHAWQEQRYDYQGEHP